MKNKLDTLLSSHALKACALVIATFLAIHNNVAAAPDPLPDDLRQVPISDRRAHV